MTAPTGKPRGRTKGCAKTGGRVAGKSLDRSARQLVSSDLAGSILETFEALGGTDAMIAWARTNETVFFTQILARLYPSPQRDDADIVQNNVQVNIDGMSDIQIAARVAFALSKGLHAQQALEAERAPIDIIPEQVTRPDAPQEAYVSPNQWTPPTDAPDMPEPPNMSASYPLDPGRERWANELPLSPQERADRSLVRETQTSSISSYAGSGAEQGGYAQRPQVTSKPSAAQLCSRLYRRGRDLL